MLSGEIEGIVESAVNEFYLNRQCPTVAALMLEIGRRCAEKGLTAPSRKAVTSRLQARDQREVLRRRRGAAYARHKLGRIVGRLSEDEPLGLVQIDHTLADVIVVAEADRRPLGRPWLTLAIDVASRMVTGFHLSLEPPSVLSVSMVLSHAVLPKGDYLQRWEPEYEILWGVAAAAVHLNLDRRHGYQLPHIHRWL